MSSTTPSATDDPPAIPGLDLQEKVGEGGMSVVYRAVHRNLQRTVAVKLLRAVAEEGTAGPTWLREPRLMAALAHPHVVAIYDAGEVEGHNYLVMEYMAGGSLRARMKPGQLWNLADASVLLESIAQALEHIHGQGVLHLDLKPENILYAADGQVKIADFGLSIPHANASALLGGRRFQGTIDYCAPEHRSGLEVDGRYDVFSLATLAYELLTGRLPGRVYFPASRRNPRLPVALDDVLRRGLARDPSDRYASVGEFQRAFAGAWRSTAPRVSRKFRRIAFVAAVLALFPLVAYFWRPSAQQKTGLPTAESPISEAPGSQQMDRVVVVYNKPDDLSLFAGEKGGELASGSAATVERVVLNNASANAPPGFPFAYWPKQRPMMIVHSPRTWGFVVPLGDPSLGQQVLKRWPDLLQTVVPPDKNLVKAGGFDGDCLSTKNANAPWRVGDTADWTANRRITLDRPKDQPDNPALLLTNMDPSRSTRRLSCFQSVRQGLALGAIVVLRFRARSLNGKGVLSVYAVMPAEIPDADMSPVANRIRAFGSPINPKIGKPDSSGWLYWSSIWVTPTEEWQSYLVIADSPPFPSQARHRTLYIDLPANPHTATDQVWVDDVELFVWEPGSKP